MMTKKIYFMISMIMVVVLLSACGRSLTGNQTGGNQSENSVTHDDEKEIKEFFERYEKARNERDESALFTCVMPNELIEWLSKEGASFDEAYSQAYQLFTEVLIEGLYDSSAMEISTISHADDAVVADFNNINLSGDNTLITNGYLVMLNNNPEGFYIFKAGNTWFDATPIIKYTMWTREMKDITVLEEIRSLFEISLCWCEVFSEDFSGIISYEGKTLDIENPNYSDIPSDLLSDYLEEVSRNLSGDRGYVYEFTSEIKKDLEVVFTIQNGKVSVVASTSGNVEEVDSSDFRVVKK